MTAADELWLEAWREEIVADGGEASWAEKVSSSKAKDKERHGRGDLLAACRMVAGKMGLQIRDTRPERERGIRKKWDVRLLEMLRAASGEELGLGGGEGEVHARMVELERETVIEAFLKQEFRCLSQITTADGKYLGTWRDVARTAGKRSQPRWFTAVEAMCKPTPGPRRLPRHWWCGPADQQREAEGQKGRETRKEEEVTKAESAVRVAARAEGEWTEGQLEPVQAGEGGFWGYVIAPEVKEGEVQLELVSDGTGGGNAAGWAWATAWDGRAEEETREAAREAGWVPGEADSARSELGGLVRMAAEVMRVAATRRHTDNPLKLARLVTDCEGARDAALWAERAPTGKVLRHKNRVLLLEWRELARQLREEGVTVVIGWMKGHTDRVDWPYPVQAWCDEQAVVANGLQAQLATERQRPSRWDTPFLLWDESRKEPVWGGWGQEATRRSAEEQRQQAAVGESPVAAWMRWRISHFTRESEWESRPLAERHGAGARARTAAQWDNVYGPARWTKEQKAREKGKLQEYQWECAGCKQPEKGSWAAHTERGCTATEEKEE